MKTKIKRVVLSLEDKIKLSYNWKKGKTDQQLAEDFDARTETITLSLLIFY